MAQTGRKVMMVLAALAPVVATVVIVAMLFGVRDPLEKARLWALEALGGAVAQAPREAPSAPGAPSQAEAGRQMESAYSELVRQLEPQVKSEQIGIEQSQGKLEIRFLEQVLFDSGSAKITREGQEVLEKTGQALALIKGRPFTILGHTDNRPIQTGQYPSNWELSTARASSVVRFLSEKAGIEPERFFAVGRAECDPVGDNATDAGRMKNRRVEILVTDLECLALPSRAAGR